MDGFSGYNQIKMYKNNILRVSFIIDFAIFCYLVMTFGHKNAGATYYRFINKIFKDIIGKTLKVYVDDMLVKNLVKSYHITHIWGRHLKFDTSQDDVESCQVYFLWGIWNFFKIDDLQKRDWVQSW